MTAVESETDRAKRHEFFAEFRCKCFDPSMAA
jgi:hypothetical protein